MRGRQAFFACVLIVLSACASGTTAAPVRALKLYISEAGLYRVTRQQLRAQGFEVGASDLVRVQLMHRGTQVPLLRDTQADDFSLTFYAAPEPSDYTPHDVYWLSLADVPVAPMVTRAVEPARAEPIAASFTMTLKLEENSLYSATAYDDEHWFWQLFAAPATRTITATLPALAAPAGQVQVALAGTSEGPHTVQLSLNDQPLGDARWDGRAAFVYPATVTHFQSGKNFITLRAPGAPGQAEVNLLDALTLTYARAFVADDDALAFWGSTQNFHVGGFRDPQPLLFDVSNPLQAARLTGQQFTRSNDGVMLSFYDPQPERRYLAVAASKLRAPAELRAVRANTLRDSAQRADYLVIAPSHFLAALLPLVELRAARGLRVSLIDVEQVYDAFDDGRATPQAIRRFLAYAREHWSAPAPRFVLLVGKASYDYHDYLNGPNKNLLPTYFVATPHLGEAASDNWFVAESDSHPQPALAIGRIPAKTVEQVRVAVEKIIAYESRAAMEVWQRRAVFVADDKDAGFAASSDAFAASLPAPLSAEKIYLARYGGDVAAARAQLVRAWSAGAGLLTYIGHGSLDTWAAGPLFGGDHLNQVRNGGRLPILLTPTCLDGFFYHPQKDSLAENLLFKSDGGMIAGLVPTGLSLPEAQDALVRALFAHLFERGAPTLGEAIQRALRETPTDTPALREVVETFVLLGDPALKNPFAAR